MSQHRRARGVVATARWVLCDVCCLVLMFGCRRLFCFRWRFWFFIFLGSCCVTSSTLLFTSDFTHYRPTSFSRAIMTTLPPALKPPAPPPPALFLASGYPLPIQPSNPSAHTSHTSSTACACSPHALRMAHASCSLVTWVLLYALFPHCRSAKFRAQTQTGCRFVEVQV